MDPETPLSLSVWFSQYTCRLSQALQGIQVSAIEALARNCLAARAENRQIFLLGNGGSAANASHIANDLCKLGHEDGSNRFRVISLTDNVAQMTAIANDCGYASVFVQQLKNLLQPGDLVIAISTSGNSPNVVQAVEFANARGALTCGIAGFSGGALKATAQTCIHIPTDVGDYGCMEDATLAVGHIISTYIQALDREQVGASADTESS